MGHQRAMAVYRALCVLWFGCLLGYSIKGEKRKKQKKSHENQKQTGHEYSSTRLQDKACSADPANLTTVASKATNPTTQGQPNPRKIIPGTNLKKIALRIQLSSINTHMCENTQKRRELNAFIT